MNSPVISRTNIAPIPVLIAVIAAIYLIFEPSLYFEPWWIPPVANTIFVTLAFLAMAYVAGRTYCHSGRIQLLLMGCGLLSFAVGGAIAGWIRYIPGTGADLSDAVYVTAALLGAIFHFIAAFVLLAGISPAAGERRVVWVRLSYGAVVAALALFSAASTNRLIPSLLVQGAGLTLLRQYFLGTAVILFAFSSATFMAWYIRKREEFLYWYASALALTCISVGAFLLQRSVGTPIGWTGRFSQYLTGIALLIAILTAIRSAQSEKISFDNVIARSLNPSEQKPRALAEDYPDIIDRFDRDLKHVYINPAGLRFYAKTADAIVGKSIEETGFPEPCAGLWKERIRQVFQTRQPIDGEDYFPTAEGTKFLVSHCVPEYGADGAVTNVLVLARDLTEHKRADEVQIQTEKLASVARLAGTIAHELNNPLAGAVNALYLVTRDESLSPESRRFAELAERELRRATQIARRILGLYREPKTRTAVIIEQVIRDLALAHEPYMKDRNIHLHVRCGDHQALVTGNASELLQLFSNLLANSIDAVARGGTVHIRTKNCTMFGEPFVRVTVADTGAGIEHHCLSRVFEPFFTTKKNIGTGLGLWVCWQIVTDHHGSIRVRSRVGRGTVVTVRLPAAAKQAASRAGT